MKPPKPKPLKPTTRWAIVDAEGELIWVAVGHENIRRYARSMSRLFHCRNRVTRALITEAK